MAYGQLDDLFRSGTQALCFIELGFADTPVLAKATTQVAAGGAETEDFTARQEMVQRLFLDRIDGEAGRCAITKGIKFAADVLPNVTEAGLTLAHAAITRAERAENLSVSFSMPPQGFFHTGNIPLLRPSRKWQES